MNHEMTGTFCEKLGRGVLIIFEKNRIVDFNFKFAQEIKLQLIAKIIADIPVMAGSVDPSFHVALVIYCSIACRLLTSGRTKTGNFPVCNVSFFSFVSFMLSIVMMAKQNRDIKKLWTTRHPSQGPDGACLSPLLSCTS